jgi:hypothetical protein
MRRQKLHIFIGLSLGLLSLITTSTFAQTTFKKSADKFIDSLKQSNSDTIIEIRINNSNQNHHIHLPSTYIYFKNNPEFYYKFCGKKFDNKIAGKTECNNNLQTLFGFIPDHWAAIKNEILLPDTTILPDGTVRFSSPNHFDVVEIIFHFKEKTEKIIIRKDYFLPTDNRHHKTNILTMTYLFLTLVENYNDEIDNKNNH